MAPPKVRMHKTTGKLKSIPRPSGPPPQPAASVAAAAAAGSTSDGTATAGSSEADRQFELELYWCIQQLESSLNLPHVRESNKKMDDTTKLINTLKSATQPIIRKRQIMRTTFGDYRSKMAAEEQSMAVNPDSVRFEEGKPKVKYHFVKKASILNGSKDFRFNFPVTENGTADAAVDPEPTSATTSSSERNTEKGEKSVEPPYSCKYVPSDNSFRFNFAASSSE